MFGWLPHVTCCWNACTQIPMMHSCSTHSDVGCYGGHWSVRSGQHDCMHLFCEHAMRSIMDSQVETQLYIGKSRITYNTMDETFRMTDRPWFWRWHEVNNCFGQLQSECRPYCSCTVPTYNFEQQQLHIVVTTSWLQLLPTCSAVVPDLLQSYCSKQPHSNFLISLTQLHTIL